LSINLGIIAALPFEAACIAGNDIRPGTYQFVAPNLYVFSAGTGPDNASRAAKTLIDLDVDAIMSWGVAGSLIPNLVSGDIVMPVMVLDTDGQCFPVNQRWHAALKIKLRDQGVHSEGSLISTFTVQADVRLKSELHRSTQAIAVDMESAAIAKVANSVDKPFAVIRTIFDSLSMRVPTSSVNAINQYGQVSLPKLIFGLTQRPAELLQYPKLINSFAKAKRSLQRVVELCDSDFSFSNNL